VGTFSSKILAYKTVAITAGNNLFSWTNVKWAAGAGIKPKYALPKMDRWFPPVRLLSIDELPYQSGDSINSKSNAIS